jgi:hypothetical protein
MVLFYTIILRVVAVTNKAKNPGAGTGIGAIVEKSEQSSKASIVSTSLRGGNSE